MSGAGGLWSRRRAAVAAEEQAERAALEAQALAEEQAALEEKSDAEILAELELPEPESLREGDDFSGFMAKAVPERIRRRALRVLWRSNPVLANVDMLVDYGEDFTDGANVVENMQTAYQVGKGMLKHVEEMARKAEEKARAGETPAQEDEVEEAEAPALTLADDETPGTTTSGQDRRAQDEMKEQDMAEDEAPPARPRRMKFRIGETA